MKSSSNFKLHASHFSSLAVIVKKNFEELGI